MLPMVAIAVLACVVGYYVKNKFFKDDEDKEEKEKSEQKKIEGQKFPNQPKANKPWLTAQGTLFLRTAHEWKYTGIKVNAVHWTVRNFWN